VTIRERSSVTDGFQRLVDARSRTLQEAFQIRRAFILADLGHWKKSLSILEAIKSPQEYEEGVAFYLGHCYLAGDEYERAKDKLTDALKLELPASLQYRAHCELGMAYYNLKDYAKAKRELEKGVEGASADYIKQSNIWKWLEMTCRALGLQAEWRDRLELKLAQVPVNREIEQLGPGTVVS
jgi:tetratricopeptide (TPR) repeat protein